MRGAVALRAVSDVVARLVAVAALPLVVRAYGAGGYGTYALVMAVSYFAVPLATLSLGQALVRFRQPGEPSAVSRARLRRASVLVVAVLAVLGAAAALAAAVVDDATPVVLAVGSLVAALCFEQLLLDHLRANGSFYRYGVLQLVLAGTTLAVLVGAPGRARDVSTLVLVLALVRAVPAALLLLAVTVVVAAPPNEPGDLRRQLSFTLPLVVAGLGAWAIYLTGRFAVAWFDDGEALGAYSAALTAAGVLTLISNALGLPAYPRMVAAAAVGDDALSAELDVFSRLTAYALFPAAVLIGLQLPAALDLLAGSGRLELGLVAAVLIVLASALEQWNVPVQYALLASGRSRSVRDAWLAAGAVNLVACVVLVPAWGATGAGAAGVASMGCFLEVNRRSLRRALPCTARGRSVWRTSVSAVACGCAVALADVALDGSSTVVRLAVGTSAGLVAFVVCLVATGEAPAGLRRISRPRAAAPDRGVGDA